MMEHILYEELWQTIMKKVFLWFRAQKPKNKYKEMKKLEKIAAIFILDFDWMSTLKYLIHLGYHNCKIRPKTKILFVIKYDVTT